MDPHRLLASFGLLVLAGACGPRFVDAASEVGEPSLAAEVFVAGDGARLPLRRWAPEGEPSGVVVALHSFGDFGHAFDDLGPLLAAQGLLVLAPDQRGFGEAPARGRWWGHARMVADAVELAALARRAHGVDRVDLIGESMGGAVALLAAAGNAGVGRVAVAAPAVRGELPNRWLIDAALRTAARLAPSHTRTVDHAGPHLTGPARRRLDDDPRVIREVRVDTYWGLIRLANAASAQAPEALPPTLVQFGTADATVPRISACVQLQSLGARDEGRVYADVGHRLWQDARGDRARRDVVDWLARRDLPPVRASGEVLAPGAYCAAVNRNARRPRGRRPPGVDDRGGGGRSGPPAAVGERRRRRARRSPR